MKQKTVFQISKIEDKAIEAASFLKAMASPHRLMILCQLVNGEKCVGDIMQETGIPQTSMSQHLNRLKEEGIIDFRRDHRTLYYRIEDKDALKLMHTMYEIFCSK